MAADGDDPATAAQRFYTRYGDAYDLLATRTPLVERVRRRTVAALDPDPEAVVADIGCGTGANFPRLREAVGPEGSVVGVDFAPGMVARARDRAAGWPNVHVVRGDAARPPIPTERPRWRRPVDAVVATFLSGMLADPAAAVDAWADAVGPGGRLCLFDLAGSDGVGRPLNPLFRLAVVAGAPPGAGAGPTDPTATLNRRVETAHRRLAERCRAHREETTLLGFGRLSAGTVE